MRYPVCLFKTEEGFDVLIPDFPGCFSHGATFEQALSNVQEAVECHLHGEDVELPAPSDVGDLIGQPDYAGGLWALADLDLSSVGKARRINVTIPERALKSIDEHAERSGLSRSAFLAKAALESISRSRA